MFEVGEKMYALKQKWLIIILLDCLFIMLSLFKPATLMMVLVLLVWSNGLIYSLLDLEKRGAMCAFLISFFLILIGRETLEIFGLHEVELKYSIEINRFAESLLLISLLAIYMGFLLAKHLTFDGRCEIENNYNSQKYVSVRLVSRILFFLTFAFNIFTVLDIVLFVVRHGYITYYTSYVSGVPYLVKKIGDMCLICFWIFLATMPEKKEVFKISVFYILYLLLTLGTGKRFPFVAGILTLFVYLIARNRVNSGGQLWIRQRTIVILVLLAPLLMVALYIIGKTRVDSVIGSFRLDKIISNFLYGQGVSVNVIKRAQVYKDSIPQDKSYLFGSTYEAISNNIVFRLLGAKQYSGNTIDHALNGYSFQHAISYAVMGEYYVAGHGLGSCYIAEAFHDLGYAGVVIVNLIYGVLFCKAFDLKRHGIWGTAIIISMLYSLLLAPRGSADGFIIDLVDLTTWGTILIVGIISHAL